MTKEFFEALSKLEAEGKDNLAQAFRRAYVNPPMPNESVKQFLEEQIVGGGFYVFPIGIAHMANDEYTTVFRFANELSQDHENKNCQLVFGGKIKLNGILRPRGKHAFFLDLYNNISEEHMDILVKNFPHQIYLNVL